MDKDTALVVFQGKKIRRVWHNSEWFFSVVDVVSALTDSADPKDYWYRMKKRESEASEIELSTFCRQLKLPSTDGKVKGKKISLRDFFPIVSAYPPVNRHGGITALKIYL